MVIKERTRCDTCCREVPEDQILYYALAGVPVSVGNCQVCAGIGAYPYWILVTNTAMIGGMDEAADWWVDAVVRSLAVVTQSVFDFDKDVDDAIQEMNEILSEPEDFEDPALD